MPGSCSLSNNPRPGIVNRSNGCMSHRLATFASRALARWRIPCRWRTARHPPSSAGRGGPCNRSRRSLGTSAGAPSSRPCRSSGWSSLPRRLSSNQASRSCWHSSKFRLPVTNALRTLLMRREVHDMIDTGTLEFVMLRCAARMTCPS